MTQLGEIQELILSVEKKLGRQICILVIDDEEDCYELFARAVPGCDAVWARTGEQGIDILRADPHHFDAVVIDQKLPGMQGIDVLKTIRAEWSHVFTVMSSGFLDAKIQAELDALGHVYLLRKRIQPKAVREFLSFIMERRSQ